MWVKERREPQCAPTMQTPNRRNCLPRGQNSDAAFLPLSRSCFDSKSYLSDIRRLVNSTNLDSSRKTLTGGLWASVSYPSSTKFQHLLPCATQHALPTKYALGSSYTTLDFVIQLEHSHLSPTRRETQNSARPPPLTAKGTCRTSAPEIANLTSPQLWLQSIPR